MCSVRRLLTLLIVLLAVCGILLIDSKTADTKGNTNMNPTDTANFYKSVTPGYDTIFNPNASASDLTAATGSATGNGNDFYNVNNTPTSTTTQGVNDPNTLAQYDQAINNTQSAIDRLPGQLNSGLSGVDASSQNALSQLLLGKNQGQQAYTTNKNQTSSNYIQGKNTVGFNAGNSLNSLLRLLGSRGAGGGSPLGAARGAVAGEATQQRTGLGNTFAQNNQSLDTNWNNYLTGYNNQVSGVGSQKAQQEQQLRGTASTNQASLLQSLATLAAQKATATGGSGAAAAQPYLDQANALLNSTNNYNVAPINYQTQAYAAPDLASYTTNPNSTPTVKGQTATNDYTSPYLAALLGKKQAVA